MRIVHFVYNLIACLVYSILIAIKWLFGFLTSRALKPIAYLILIATPYVSSLAAVSAYKQRGYIAVGGESFVPILMVTGAFYLLWLHIDLSRVKSEERITWRGKDGSANVDSHNIHRAVSKLCDIEDEAEDMTLGGLRLI